jgi:hypothetical protein
VTPPADQRADERQDRHEEPVHRHAASPPTVMMYLPQAEHRQYDDDRKADGLSPARAAGPP